MLDSKGVGEGKEKEKKGEERKGKERKQANVKKNKKQKMIPSI